ncbi:MAG: hypothetical protein Q8K64_12915 [Sediminibacterium sp.]|nr:hypothetical protein [Sediminibacterium sp.]
MTRKCKYLIGSKDGKRAIYLDEENKAEIWAYLTKDNRHKKKFKFISEIILDGHRNTDVYDKEEINNKCKDVTAMKFFKGQDNDRIYCKEIHSTEGTFIVVAAILYEKKKTTKLNQEQINIIEKVGSYNYEI